MSAQLRPLIAVDAGFAHQQNAARPRTAQLRLEVSRPVERFSPFTFVLLSRLKFPQDTNSSERLLSAVCEQ